MRWREPPQGGRKSSNFTTVSRADIHLVGFKIGKKEVKYAQIWQIQKVVLPDFRKQTSPTTSLWRVHHALDQKRQLTLLSQIKLALNNQRCCIISYDLEDWAFKVQKFSFWHPKTFFRISIDTAPLILNEPLSVQKMTHSKIEEAGLFNSIPLIILLSKSQIFHLVVVERWLLTLS